MEFIDYELLYCTRREDSQSRCLVSDWSEAERVAVQWTRRFGYTDARLTVPGNDDGIDVVATGAVAQVKWRVSKNAGIEDVQRIVGAAKPGQVALFFSKRGYTGAALQWADDADTRLALFLLQDDGHVTAGNRYAMEVLVRSPYRTPPYLINPTPVGTRLWEGSLSLLGAAAGVVCVGGVIVSDWSAEAGMRVMILLLALFCGGVCIAMFCVALGSSIKRLVGVIRQRRWPGLRVILTDTVASRPEVTLPWDEFVGIQTSDSVRLGIWLEHLLRQMRKVVRDINKWWYRRWPSERRVRRKILRDVLARQRMRRSSKCGTGSPRRGF